MGSFGNSLERWTAPSAGRRSPTHSDPFCNASDAAQGSPLSLRHRRRCAHRSVCGRRNGGAASSQDPLPRTSMRIALRSGRPRMDGLPTRGTGESFSDASPLGSALGSNLPRFLRLQERVIGSAVARGLGASVSGSNRPKGFLRCVVKACLSGPGAMSGPTPEIHCSGFEFGIRKPRVCVVKRGPKEGLDQVGFEPLSIGPFSPFLFTPQVRDC